MPIAAKPFEMITVFGSYAWNSRATQILCAPTSDTTMSEGPSARRSSAIARCGAIGEPSLVSIHTTRAQGIAGAELHRVTVRMQNDLELGDCLETTDDTQRRA